MKCCVLSCKNYASKRGNASKDITFHVVITFGLSCLLCGAVAIGLTIAIIAGIAYGYNYCMAEFITFTRSDVTVYMRRGQFYDKPDIMPLNRRSGSSEEDLFDLNRKIDYEEPAPIQGKPLSDTWMKTQDTRNYAEKLTKYSPNPQNDPRRILVQEPNPKPIRVEELQRNSLEPTIVSIVPNKIIPGSRTSGSTTILMRNFSPIQEIKRPDFRWQYPRVIGNSDVGPNVKPVGFISGKHKENTLLPARQHVTAERNFLPMRATQPSSPDYATEEIDEDNIVYKPV